MSVQTEIDRISQNVENTYTALEALGCDIPEAKTSNNLAPTAGTSKVVKYEAQTLTNEQKAQARTNIGAASDDYDLILYCDNEMWIDTVDIVYTSNSYNNIADVYEKVLNNENVNIVLRSTAISEECKAVFSWAVDNILYIGFMCFDMDYDKPMYILVRFDGEQITNNYVGNAKRVIVDYMVWGEWGNEIHNLALDTQKEVEQLKNSTSDLVIWCEYPFSAESCEALFTMDDGYNKLATVRDKLNNGENVNIVMKNADYGEESKALFAYTESGALRMCFICHCSEYNYSFYVYVRFDEDIISDDYVGYASNVVIDYIVPSSAFEDMATKEEVRKVQDSIADLENGLYINEGKPLSTNLLDPETGSERGNVYVNGAWYPPFSASSSDNMNNSKTYVLDVEVGKTYSWGRYDIETGVILRRDAFFINFLDASGNYVEDNTNAGSSKQKVTIPEGVSQLVLTLIEYASIEDTEPSWVYLVTEGGNSPNKYVPFEIAKVHVKDKLQKLESNAETWTFTLEDGSTVTKKVVLT